MPPAKKAKTDSDPPESFTLRYFDVMAKGLGPTLVAQFSGLPWKGNVGAGYDRSQWAALKPKTPFGQLPLLTTADGTDIAQTTAIINYIGKVAGTEGKDAAEFATSQMCLAEGEDIFALMSKFVPTIFAKLGAGSKGTKEEYDAFWAEKVPAHLQHLNRLLLPTEPSGKFSASGETPGELYLWSVLHQATLIKPDLLVAPKGGQPSLLSAFYTRLLSDKRTQVVLDGASSMGELKQYFVAA